MQELELTAQRLLSVWWLLIWRGWIGGLIIGAVAGALAGIALAFLGHSEQGSIAGTFAGMAVGPFWGLLITHMALKKNYKNFRIALVSR
jgi:uncharacterized membrane protein YeaQ/YmgE (transglycosylase-associated protein family)